jgi:purine-binding chemotaxis protein CheW
MSEQLHVVFRVGDTEYAISAGEVSMMETWEGATRVPGAPPFVAGLVQVRGDVVPVIDLRARFGLPPAEPSLDTRVLVVGDGARRVGLKVDQAREVLRIDEAQTSAPPDEIARGTQRFVRAIARARGRLLMVVDAARVAGAEEDEHG